VKLRKKCKIIGYEATETDSSCYTKKNERQLMKRTEQKEEKNRTTERETKKKRKTKTNKRCEEKESMKKHTDLREL